MAKKKVLKLDFPSFVGGLLLVKRSNQKQFLYFLKLSAINSPHLVYLCSPKRKPCSSTLHLSVLVVVNWAKWLCLAPFKGSLLMMTVCCACGSLLLNKCGGNHKTKYLKFSQVEDLLWLWPLLHLCPGSFMPFLLLAVLHLFYYHRFLLPLTFSTFYFCLLSVSSVPSQIQRLTHFVDWLANVDRFFFFFFAFI